MRTLLTSLALIAGISLMAQDADDKDKKTPDERAAHRTESMTKSLGLNADQVGKVSEINLVYARSSNDLKDLPDGEMKKNRMKALRESRDSKLHMVLTTEQYSKMLELREEKNQAKDKKDDKKPHNE